MRLKMVELSNEAKKRLKFGGLTSWQGALGEDISNSINSTASSPESASKISKGFFDDFSNKIANDRLYSDPNIVNTVQGSILPSGMPSQQATGLSTVATQPPIKQPVPQLSQQQQQPMVPNQGISNLYNQQRTNVQPNQLQSLNPYAGVQIAGVSQVPFAQEQQALRSQGEVLSRATQEQGKSLQNLNAQQQTYFKDLQTKSQSNIQQYKTETQDYDKKLEEINKQYPLLNRQQVIDNMSVGDKIMKGIGLVLGGIGAGMSGRENVALDLVNKQIDSVLDVNRANYQRNVEQLNAKRAKSASDFDMTRQQLNDNATMQNNIFSSIKDKIDAQFKVTSSPAVRYQLEAAGAQVMQRMAQMNQQNALQNMQLQLQGRQWAAQMAMNPRAVQLGTDSYGKPIQGVAASDKSAEVLREQLPALDQKISAVKDMVDYLNQAPKTSGKSQSLIGKNLEGMKQNVAKAFGLDPKEMPDIVQSIGRDSTDFYNQLLEQATKNKQNVINANIIK